MQILGFLSLIVAVLAAIYYLVSSHTKGTQLALYAFWAGTLAFLLHADKMVKLFD